MSRYAVPSSASWVTGRRAAAGSIHILRQVCESLGEAHDLGMVHRDIKPANIQICRRGRDYDYVNVLDFGLVKRLRPTDGGEPVLTAPEVVAGTPAYLSPETLSGDPVDGRSDIYSLGCVAYWMLTGRHVLQSTPVPPSHFARDPVPAELDATVLACLAKHPRGRHASAWDLADRLAECELADAWTREDATLVASPAHARAGHSSGMTRSGRK